MELPFRGTVKQGSVYVRIRNFPGGKPSIWRIYNESNNRLYLSDRQFPSAKDTESYWILEPRSSACPPFDGIDIWAMAPDGDIDFIIISTQSKDPVEIARIAADTGGAAGATTVQRYENRSGGTLYVTDVGLVSGQTYTTVSPAFDVATQHSVMLQPYCTGVSSNASGEVEILIARSVDGVSKDNANLSNCVSISVYLNGTTEVSTLSEVNTKGCQKIYVAAIVNKSTAAVSGMNVKTGLPWSDE